MGRGHLWRIGCVAEEECSSEECRLEQAFVIMSFTAKLEKVRFLTLAKWGLDRDVGFCYSLTLPRFPDEDGGLITRAATLAPRAFSTPHRPRSLWRCIWHSQMSQHLAGRWSAQPGVTWGFHQPLEKTHKVELKVPKLGRSARPPPSYWKLKGFPEIVKHYRATQKKIVMGHRSRGRQSSAFFWAEGQIR